MWIKLPNSTIKLYLSFWHLSLFRPNILNYNKMSVNNQRIWLIFAHNYFKHIKEWSGYYQNGKIVSKTWSRIAKNFELCINCKKIPYKNYLCYDMWHNTNCFLVFFPFSRSWKLECTRLCCKKSTSSPPGATNVRSQKTNLHSTQSKWRRISLW